MFGGTLGEYVVKAERKCELSLMVHVLERFVDPGAGLRGVRELLNENGIAYVEVPNVLFRRSLEVAHPYSVHAGSRRMLLVRKGLQALKVVSHGGPSWPHARYCLSLIAERAAAGQPAGSGRSWNCVLGQRRRGRMLAWIIELPEWVFGRVVVGLRRVLGEEAYGMVRVVYRRIRGRVLG